MKRHRMGLILVRNVLLAVVALTLAGWSAHAEPPSDQAVSQPNVSLPTLRRVVRHFDFEEAVEAPYQMPLNFYRYGGGVDGGSSQGFPPFGTMQLSDEAAASGSWSFQFSLEGGSLAARIPTAVIPAVPLADYAVTTRVRTAGLTHARARLVAWLHDKRGDMIPESRVASDLVDTGGEWDTLSVHVQGNEPDAADLVLELQLLQPRQFLDDQAQSDGPLLEDVSGHAWFDDVTVWHAPRIELATPQPGNVIAANENLDLSLLVRDLTHEELTAHVQVYDLDGETAYRSSFAAPRTSRPQRIRLDDLPYGWYRAVLDVRKDDTLIARRWLDFIRLAPQRPDAPRRGDTFGVNLLPDWRDRSSAIDQLVARLGCGAVIVPVSSRSNDVPRDDAALERDLISALRGEGQHITVALQRIAEATAQSMNLSPSDVLGALARDPALIRDSFAGVLRSASEIQRWQLGPLPQDGAGALADGRTLASAANAMNELVPSAELVLGSSAERPGTETVEGYRRLITMPQEVRGSALAEYVPAWQSSASPFSLHLQTASPELYRPRERSHDLFFRALYALREACEQMYIDAPWQLDQDARRMPQPEYVVWRQLASHLNQRSFVGAMDLPNGGHVWLFEGNTSGDDVLVAWSDAAGERERSLVMQLADHPVTVYDMFGNSHEVAQRDGDHVIELTASPVFIEGINLPLVQFRGGFALEPALIPSEHRTHQHEFVLHNPWDMPLAGTLAVDEQSHWRISPRQQQFTIDAGGQVRLPVEIVFDRSVPAGVSTLRAEAVLEADGNYRVRMSTEVEIGLPHIDFTATSAAAENAETGEEDLVITLYITNTGDDAVFADAFLVAPGVPQSRRLIAGLEPGQMAVRTFRVANGVERFAGKRIRVTVADRNGSGRLNHSLEIPDHAASGNWASASPE